MMTSCSIQSWTSSSYISKKSLASIGLKRFLSGAISGGENWEGIRQTPFVRYIFTAKPGLWRLGAKQPQLSANSKCSPMRALIFSLLLNSDVLKINALSKTFLPFIVFMSPWHQKDFWTDALLTLPLYVITTRAFHWIYPCWGNHV